MIKVTINTRKCFSLFVRYSLRFWDERTPWTFLVSAKGSYVATIAAIARGNDKYDNYAVKEFPLMIMRGMGRETRIEQLFLMLYDQEELLYTNMRNIISLGY